MTAAVLLVLLLAEGLTIPFLGQQLTLHFVLGCSADSGGRAEDRCDGVALRAVLRRQSRVRAKGPPQVLMRVLVAPLTVVSTIVLFGSGVLLIALDPQKGLLLTVTRRASSSGSPR